MSWDTPMLPNTMDAAGAYILKTKIIKYWVQRGFPAPNVYTIRDTFNGESGARYDVRSNMVGGWPSGRPA